MTNRKIAAKNTKRKLLNAAFELLKEKGFEGINVEDITKRAGVGKGTFYTYFKRKEDIVLEISRTPFSEIAIELENMEGVIITEKLTFYCRRFMQCVESCGKNACREWIRNVIDPNTVHENIDGQKWNYDVDMLYKILEKSVTKGELSSNTPIELLTHIIISELYGMMTCWCMSDGKFEPLDWTDDFCKFQLEKLFNNYMTERQEK